MSHPKPSRPPRRASPGPDQRRLEILVPDVRAPAFRHEAQRQAAAVAASRQARDDQDFIDAISADPEH
ncbi:antitoxin MazE-like protein [Methylobacterium sp. 174MFSha1.1]|uniref:antitoxin MazE-like protein n=1 Tax=Methylobacterium sp. 174MFSha1.1 TaxID=1502749 RepID=UPI000B844217|nr:antitoxin MazE-like protein [Methylobacterium sp. 174MFSha1.1]